MDQDVLFRTEKIDKHFLGPVHTEGAFFSGTAGSGLKELVFNLNGAHAVIDAPSEGVFRYTICRDGSTVPESYALEGTSHQPFPLMWQKHHDPGQGNGVHILVDHESFDNAALRVRFNPFGIDLYQGNTLLSSSMGIFRYDGSMGEDRFAADGDEYYGLGEGMTPLGRRGYIFENWNTDDGRHHDETTRSMYLSMPFFISSVQSDTNGDKEKTSPVFWGYFLDSTYRSVFDMASTDWNVVTVKNSAPFLRVYLICGDTPAKVLKRYTLLTGRHKMPPLWSLGYHQCRYSYMTTGESKEIAETLRQKKIPCDAIWFDIDHMDSYRVFTFDKKRFTDVKHHFNYLTSLGFRKVVIVDPGVKNDPPGIYPVTDEGTQKGYFVRYPDGSEYSGSVWPGGVKFPDFSREDVRSWWRDLHKIYTDVGVDGFWNDMNEPSVLDAAGTVPDDVILSDNGKDSPMSKMHNVYANLEAQATIDAIHKFIPGSRPFLLSRAGSPGIQRDCAIWCGDNSSTWAHLAGSLAQIVNMGLSGIGFCGVDVGGFLQNATPELFARWIQAGILYPFFRNHSAVGTSRQEPWSFGERVEKIAKDAISLRYRLLPYFYQQFYTMAQTGSPVVRALFWDYTDSRSASVFDQVLVGPKIMAAPVVSRGARERLVWFPEGQWLDYESAELFDGNQSLVVAAPLEKLPLFVKAGTLLPVEEGSPRHTGEFDTKTLTVEFWPDKELLADPLYFYEDDGLTEQYLSGNHAHSKVFVKNGKLVVETAESSQFTRIRIIHRTGSKSGELDVADIQPGGSVEFSIK